MGFWDALGLEENYLSDDADDEPRSDRISGDTVKPNKRPADKEEIATISTDFENGLILDYDNEETDLTEDKTSVEYGAMGTAQAREGNYTEAIRFYTKAIALNAEDFRFFCNRYWCYENIKAYQLALEDADRAIKLNPFRAKPLFMRGRALVGLKRYEQAEQAFATAEKMDSHATEDYQEELLNVRYLALKEIGFDEICCMEMARKHSTIQQGIEGILQGPIKTSNNTPQKSTRPASTNLLEKLQVHQDVPRRPLPSSQFQNRETPWSNLPKPASSTSSRSRVDSLPSKLLSTTTNAFQQPLMQRSQSSTNHGRQRLLNYQPPSRLPASNPRRWEGSQRAEPTRSYVAPRCSAPSYENEFGNCHSSCQCETRNVCPCQDDATHTSHFPCYSSRQSHPTRPQESCCHAKSNHHTHHQPAHDMGYHHLDHHEPRKHGCSHHAPAPIPRAPVNSCAHDCDCNSSQCRPISVSSLLPKRVLTERAAPDNVFGYKGLWIGNVSPDACVERLKHVFGKYGAIVAANVAGNSFCAFVYYQSARSPSLAIFDLAEQVVEGISNGPRYLRFRFTAGVDQDKGARAPDRKDSDECYFWRTTGCVQGRKCSRTHNRLSRGVDMQPWMTLDLNDEQL